MKRIALFGIAVLFGLFLSSPVFCAPSGNPNDIQTPHGPGFANMEAANMGFLTLGGEFDFVVERKLESNDSDGVDPKVDEEHWYMGKISYTILNRMQAFVLLGGANSTIKWEEEEGFSAKLESSTDFAWGVGGKVFIYEIPDWKVRITANGLYRSLDTEIDNISISGGGMTISADASSLDTEFELHEWQVGGTFSREFALSEGTAEEPGIILVPYIGVNYADSEVKISMTGTVEGEDITGTEKAENHIKIGMPVGADLLIGNNLALSVEGRFFADTAIAVGATIKF